MGSRFVTCVEALLRISKKPRDGDWALLIESMAALSDSKDLEHKREYELCGKLAEALGIGLKI